MLLLALGLLGWLAQAKIRVPVPEVLGPAALIGALRRMQVELPTFPSYIFPVDQIMIGILIGFVLSKVYIRSLKSIALATTLCLIRTLTGKS